jgi:outer membrane receptor protein involved in Fe transport
LSIDQEMALQTSYGGTVARPQVREVAPFLFQDYVRRRTVQGNPDLLRTYIHNVDLRWEYFPAPNDVLAVSLFYKEFLHPIEQVILDRAGNITFLNVDSAQNFGGEVEARLGLGQFWESLQGWSVGANLAVVHSQVALSPDQQRNATNAERALAGQSPFMANFWLGFEPPETGLSVYAYYNVYGERIEEVGRLGLADVLQQPFHSLDLTVTYTLDDHWRLRAAARNLLLQHAVLTQGDVDISDANPGTSVTLGVTWSY